MPPFYTASLVNWFVICYVATRKQYIILFIVAGILQYFIKVSRQITNCKLQIFIALFITASFRMRFTILLCNIQKSLLSLDLISNIKKHKSKHRPTGPTLSTRADHRPVLGSSPAIDQSFQPCRSFGHKEPSNLLSLYL